MLERQSSGVSGRMLGMVTASLEARLSAAKVLCPFCSVCSFHGVAFDRVLGNSAEECPQLLS